MSWQQLTLHCNQQQAQSLENFFNQQQALSIMLTDAADSPIFEPDLNTHPLWPDVVMTAMFPADRPLLPMLQALKRQFQTEFKHKVDILEDKDWVREWMDNYHPVQISDNLWICPSWLEPVDPGAVNILLDPGLAFGTGTHATTALCLKWLARQSRKEQFSELKMLDFGCGSGILSVAALKLGAQHLVAMDIDPQAVTATRLNADKNQLSDRINVMLDTTFYAHYQRESFDIVMANILAGPLVSLAGQISGALKQGGRLILSGLLDTQIDDVQAAYQSCIRFDRPQIQDDWVCLSGQKI